MSTVKKFPDDQTLHGETSKTLAAIELIVRWLETDENNTDAKQLSALRS